MSKQLFPAPREAWVVSYLKTNVLNRIKEMFPSPLEVWVVSY